MPKTALNQERWRRVEELYHAALDREPAQRNEFLNQACNADEDLRREVESLLAADSTESLIDRPALDAAAELLDDENPLAAGAQLGPYRIEGLLGSGGMGRVYRARDTRLGRTVALKISKEEFGKRFEQEARVVAALNHPHICQLYDVGPNYLVMELVEGAPLEGPLALAKAVEYAGQILDALDTAHRGGVVHRDLKPANILITKKGVKLLDFGLAKQTPAQTAYDATITRGLTGAGMILGTLQYMSPEQLQSKPADVRSDLFSFGCVLYEMLTGKRAFEGENPATVIAAILEREPAPLEISPPLDRVVMRCLAKDPDHRFQTAIDLKAALIWAVEQQQVAKPPRRWWMAAAALVLGVAGGWVVFHLRSTVRDERVIHFQIPPPKGAQFAPVSFSVSPDGRYVTYIAFVEGRRQLWLHALDGSVERLLADKGTPLMYPFWSPDSKSIGWAADSKLWRVDLTGGAPVVICEQDPSRQATWTPDGRILFGSLRGVMQVAASGGSPTLLTTVNRSLGEVEHGRPELLPNGRFLYRVVSSKAANDGIFIASLSSPEQRVRLMAAEQQARFAPTPDGKNYLLMQVDQRLVAQEFDVDKLRLIGEPRTIAEIGLAGTPILPAEVSRGGILLYSKNIRAKPTQLILFDRRGRSVATLSESGYDFRFSPDGRRVVLARREGGGRANIWMLDAERPMVSRFTSSSGISESPIWSPDGKTVVFSNNGLFRKDVSGSADQQRVTEMGRLREPSDWSRDGRFILFSESSLETNQDLWVLPVTPEGMPMEGEQPRPYLHSPFNEESGRFSPEPNPHWVAYQSDETGQYEIFIASFPEPRRRLQITSGGGTFPQWGADGRELFYISADNKLMAVELKFGRENIEPSTPHELFPLNAFFRSIYAVAPDGKRILANQIHFDLPSLEVIVNWPTLLKK
jgi:eukaryotic-like serine/threonine-protein kinase